MREILTVLRTRTRQEFTGYKKPTVLRRVQRRMGLARLTDMSDYVKYLRQSPAEVTSLADDLLIHVTGFFRDPEAWEVLRQRVIVPLIEARDTDGQVRGWVTACSTGDEAYTLAMLLVEESERVNKRLDIKVFATDMAERTLAQARAGVYGGGIEAEISSERLARFFGKEDSLYRVRPELRERVVFAPQNVLQDPPFSRLDIATCRNLLIYLEPDVQERVLALLHYGLREGGALFLGTSETISGTEGMFEPIDKKAKIFRRVGPTRHGSAEFPLPRVIRPTSTGSLAPGRSVPLRPTFAQITQRALLDHHMPAAVLVDRDYRIQYYQGDTRPFFSPPRGEPSRELLELTVEGVRGAARVALRRAAAENRPVTVLDGWIATTPGNRGRVAVTASPAAESGAPDHFVVSFALKDEGPTGEATDANQNQAGDEEVDHSELRRARDELQSTIEELQTSNEEMKAAAEEASSINEELQSSNEELETSKEEMQSLNEELNTVNAQLLAKAEEHQSTSNDLASLLASTDIAVLFLDTTMRIRRFTPPLRELIDVMLSDAGRPLTDLARKFEDPNLAADAESVLAKLVPVEREVAAHDGRWFLRRVTPYRTTDNRIDGIVITFVDITRRKHAELEMDRARDYAESIVKTLHEPLLVLNADLTVSTANEAFYEHFKVNPDQTIGHKIYKLGNGQWDIPALRTVLEELPPDELMFNDYEVIHEFNDLGRRVMLLNGRKLEHQKLILLGIRDVTEQHAAVAALREGEERFRLVVEGAHDFAMLLLDTKGRITSWNIGAERLLGFTEAEAVGQPGAFMFTDEDRAARAPEFELTEAAAKGRACDERWHIRKGGLRFWASGVMNAVRDPDGSLRGFVKVLRDETARKVAEDAMQAAKQTAELTNQVKDEFLATLSHELRTPLSAILLWSKMLSSESEPELLDEGLAAIRNSADSQTQLIEDLLDTSRITTGNLRLEMKPTDLTSVIESAVESVQPTAQAKGVDIMSTVASRIGTVNVDPHRMKQVLWNLLSNAVKFTPAGGKVDLNLHRVDGRIELRVTDTGRGIAAEFLPYVFESFRQADSTTTRRHGGLGLGLAICKKLVEQHGGTITAQSDGQDRGSTFIVTLPMPPRGGKVASVKVRTTPVTAQQASLTGLHVLLVEDDADTRYALATALRHAGAAVTAVESAAAAIAVYQESTFDLITSDISMPGEDGYSLISRLRAMEVERGMKRTPALALTAFVRDADQRKALDQGFDRHIGKPVDPADLVAALMAIATTG